MAKIRIIDVKYGDKTDTVFLRRLKYSTKGVLLSMRMQGNRQVETKDENGNPVKTIEMGADAVSNMFKSQLESLAAQICDESGKKIYTAEQLDEWTEEDGGDEKLKAYIEAIDVPEKTEAEVSGN